MFLYDYLITVCLSLLSYHNKIPQSGLIMNNKHLLLMVLEAGSPRSGCQQSQVLDRTLCLGEPFSLCPHMLEGTGGLCRSLL